MNIPCSVEEHLFSYSKNDDNRLRTKTPFVIEYMQKANNKSLLIMSPEAIVTAEDCQEWTVIFQKSNNSFRNNILFNRTFQIKEI